MAQWINNLNVGDVLVSNNFGEMEVTYINGSRDVGVRFTKTGTIVSKLQKGNVVRGTVADYMVRTVEGVGYLGTDDKVANTVAYKTWRSMLERCYSEGYQKTRPTYKGCSVCDEWHNFSVFKEWHDMNYVEGYHLDKDLLIQGNKIYSPTTARFIPKRINAVITDNQSSRGECPVGVSKRKKKGTKDFNGLYNVCCGTGVVGKGTYLGRFTDEKVAFERYKEFKEFLLYNYGEAYFERGLITEDVRDALMNYKIVDDRT